MPILFRLRRLFGRTSRRSARHAPCERCPLGACRTGARATVLCFACPALDADRLRALGLYEGATVGIVDTRSGMVLDVRGARLALGWKLAATITVQPVCT